MLHWLYLVPVLAVAVIATIVVLRLRERRRTRVDLDSSYGDPPVRKFLNAAMISAFKRDASKLTFMVEDLDPNEPRPALEPSATSVTDVWIETDTGWSRLSRIPNKVGPKISQHIIELCGIEPVYKGRAQGSITVHTKNWSSVQCTVEVSFRGAEPPNIAIELEYDDRAADGSDEPQALPN